MLAVSSVPTAAAPGTVPSPGTATEALTVRVRARDRLYAQGPL